MKIFTKAIEEKLKKNFEKNQELAQSDKSEDFKPVIKCFGGGAATWLFTEYDAESDLLFGLCDLGQGFPEMGMTSRSELMGIKFVGCEIRKYIFRS